MRLVSLSSAPAAPVTAVCLRALTAAERGEYARVATSLRSAWLVARALVEASGERCFADGEVAQLAEWPAALIHPIALAIRTDNILDVDFDALVDRLSDDVEERFAFRLALALGCEDPDALRARLTSRAWARWIAYFQVEPFGELRADFRAGYAMALQANLHRSEKVAAYEPADFFPSLERPANGDETAPERLRRLAEQATLASGLAGLTTNLANVPDAYLTPVDLAAKQAQPAAVAAEGA